MSTYLGVNAETRKIKRGHCHGVDGETVERVGYTDLFLEIGKTRDELGMKWAINTEEERK